MAVGNDTLTGGDHADVFALELLIGAWTDHMGDDVVTNFTVGVDRLHFDNVTLDQLNFAQVGSDTVITFDHGCDAPNSESVTLVGVDMNVFWQSRRVGLTFI